MASYKVKVDIPSVSFPGIGSPIYPSDSKEAKQLFSKDDRADYLGYVQSTQLDVSFRGRLQSDPNCKSLDTSRFSMTYDFEKDTTKTYKFLGMDIDENYNAIIKIGSGHIIVASMFDKEAVKKKLESVTRRDDSQVKIACESLLNGISVEDIRKISTSLKTGVVYEIAKGVESKSYTSDASIDDLQKLMDISKNTFKSMSSGSGVFEFSSILLNLVHERRNEQLSTSTSSASDDIIPKVLKAIFAYWSTVVERYNSIYTSLSCMDLWSDFCKKAYGESEFNNRMQSCIEIENTDTGNVEGGIVSFSGVSRNGGVFDANVVRNASSEALSNLVKVFRYGSFSTEDAYDLLTGFIDDENIDDIYSLSLEEIQALSVLDSLQYIDEDATLCKESYDMNNPDERGLFVKSAIRSYERNFKEFKPAQHYDVTEALADMVERGDLETAKQIPKSMVGPDTQQNQDIVTSTIEDINVKIDKNSLLRVMKLVSKSISQILKGF